MQDMPENGGHRSGTVLLVDDNKGVREYCGRELNREGYTVLLAGDGQDALDVLDRCGCDVVVLDVRMPVMDGVQAATCIRSRPSDVPIIIHSNSRGETELPPQLNITAWVEKSPDLTELKRVIARAMGTAGPARSQVPMEGDSRLEQR